MGGLRQHCARCVCCFFGCAHGSHPTRTPRKDWFVDESSGPNDVSASVEETNRVRAQLGLPPLKEGGAGASKEQEAAARGKERAEAIKQEEAEEEPPAPPAGGPRFKGGVSSATSEALHRHVAEALEAAAEAPAPAPEPARPGRIAKKARKASAEAPQGDFMGAYRRVREAYGRNWSHVSEAVSYTHLTLPTILLV